MKKTKLAVLFAALVSVLGFTSCLDSEGSIPSCVMPVKTLNFVRQLPVLHN